MKKIRIFLSVFIILLLLSKIIYNITAKEGIESLFGFFIFLLFIPLFYIYFLLAKYPATYAYNVLESFRDTGKFQLNTFWSLLDKINRRRLLIIIILGLILFFTFFLNILFFLKIRENHFVFSETIIRTLFLGGTIILFFYFIQQFFEYGHVSIRDCQHRKAVEIKGLIENISIKAGIKPPDFKILTYSSPTSFSLCPNFGQPVIFITSSLLNLADRNELKAVIAHQIASISSKRIFDYRTINNFLLILKILSSSLFFLFLAAINPILVFIWLGLIIYIIIGFQLEKLRIERIAEMSSKSIFAIFNPPFLLTNFISYLIYYQTSYDEFFYADLKSVQFTRYPKALYSILIKLKNYRDVYEMMPGEFYYLYFTSENTIIKRIPAPQPSIEKRKALLEEIDYTLNNMKITEEITQIKCPYCDSHMEELETKGHYGKAIKIDRCARCGSIWFDEWEIWYIADLIPHISDKTKLKQVNPLDKISCPRCGIELSIITDPNIPKDIQIRFCSSCNGNWLAHEDLLKFSSHREKYKSKKRKDKIN